MIGTTFERDGATFRVVSEYLPGVYECRSARGDIVIPAEEIRAYQGERMSDHVTQLREWARTVSLLMAEDKSNDWSEEIAELDEIERKMGA